MWQYEWQMAEGKIMDKREQERENDDEDEDGMACPKSKPILTRARGNKKLLLHSLCNILKKLL